MAKKYFSKFPVINYSNNAAIDITRRVTLLRKVGENPYVFAAKNIADGKRADLVSHEYYEDSYLNWLIYFANDIVDPYHQWYLDSDAFNQYIIDKYGSIQQAKQKIKYYENDWVNKEEITVSNYNALPADLKQYWKPVYRKTTLHAYRRKEKNWISSTNKIIKYTTANTSFTIDEKCDIVFDSINTGTGQVLSVSNTDVYIQHVSGTFINSDTVTISGSSYIYGQESKMNVAFTSSEYVANTIPQAEEIYYRPVYYYDYEEERNQFNSTIRLVDKSFADLANKNLKDLLKQ